ncbi:hypothetical protein B0H17DRAFT_1105656, partial [Mycena rosella]
MLIYLWLRGLLARGGLGCCIKNVSNVDTNPSGLEILSLPLLFHFKTVAGRSPCSRNLEGTISSTKASISVILVLVRLRLWSAEAQLYLPRRGE